MAINPENFVYNKALRIIDASNCSLYKLWSNSALVLNSLRKLYIADNKLATLTISDIKIVPGLHAIDLRNNPWKFNDELCKAINLLENKFVYPIENSNNTDHTGEGILIDNIDNFILNGWAEFHNNECPQISNALYNEEQENEELEDDKDDISLPDNNADYAKGDDDYYDEKDAEDDEDADDDDIDERPPVEVIDGENINLARVSYILSMTSVFVLTALAVLIMAVVITLCILRRNNNFNMNRANLPRFKIPLWDTQFSEKKHSGSIYRPLSEDLSGPKTPKMSRYEFSAAPTVHTSNP